MVAQPASTGYQSACTGPSFHGCLTPALWQRASTALLGPHGSACQYNLSVSMLKPCSMPIVDVVIRREAGWAASCFALGTLFLSALARFSHLEHPPQVSQLDEKLAELHSEREELERFQKADRQRRSLEFTIYDREVSEAAEKLAQVGAMPKQEQ